MNSKTHNFILYAFIAAACVLLTQTGCDSLLPSEYKAQEYTASSTEMAVYPYLAQNHLDSLGNIIDSANCHIARMRSLSGLVDSTTLANNTDNQLIVSRFNQLADSLDTLVRDSLLVISNPEDAKIGYSTFSVTAGQSKEIYIYISLHLTGGSSTTSNNINEYVVAELIRSDSSVVSSTNEMENVLVSSASQTVLVSSNSIIVPLINARYHVRVEEGLYYMRFTLSNSSAIGPFKVYIRSL
ncbi:MAG: hypothetical protein JXA06_04800 [Bacteroidetes bacterium]|nr:hypothetical protein [Bacteroidota bacterium]